jgi:hypothetical protein
MIALEKNSDMEWLVDTYFSNPQRKIFLKKGDILLKQSQYNDRLFYILSGKLSGTVKNEKDTQEIFRSFPGSFIGLHSFFSGSFKSIATVQAITDAEVVYIEKKMKVVPYQNRLTLDEQFMPVVVLDLVKRQQSELNLFKEKEATNARFLEREKQISLGKMAAGIAHELNNAVAVLFSNANWLIEKIAFYWKDQKEAAIFETGLLAGRNLGSREKRELQKLWETRHKLTADEAKALAQTGISEQAILALTDTPGKNAQWIKNLWEIGASLNDMRTAARHAAHVVKSVRLLGAQNTEREMLNINESIDNALALLQHKLKPIVLEKDLSQLPLIKANMGEMVQIWLNLIKNSIEALTSSNKANPQIKISAKFINQMIEVEIRDNGPGIPEELQQAIFEPDVTTKKSGLSFGLGLGLAIVKKIVSGHNGKIDLETSANGSSFKIYLPAENTDG